MRRPADSRPNYVPAIIAVIAIAVLVGAYSVFSNKKTDQPAPQANTPVTQQQTDQPAPPTTPEPPKEEPITVEKKTIAEKNAAYEISVDYPVFKKGEDMLSIDGDPIAKYADTSIAQFKNDYNDAKKDGSIDASPAPWSLTIEYTMQYQSDSIASVVLSYDSYEGGAHPNGVVQTYLIDLKQAKVLDLADLFTDKNYLKTLSDYAMVELDKRDISDEDWIKSGAGPTADNYASFYIDKQGLTILFDPYQVAAYAAGPQDVTIPFSKLATLKPEYVITQ